MTPIQITTRPVTINGKIRWHFISPAGQSLNTWASKRSALVAGKREWNLK